jgi:hypothetical protein
MISVDLLTAINKTGLHGTITFFTVTLATGKSLAVEERSPRTSLSETSDHAGIDRYHYQVL